ncbi:MAG: methyltransferase [Alphaproteobacteria bacterium]|nr:methyltransferase [Alphaproteobacteria bacterium]
MPPPEADLGAPETVTEDAFLGGALSLLQPRRGYRAGSDALLLAAAVRARAGARVLDVGAGVGAVALALVRRLPGVAVEGIELQPDLCQLAAANARKNGLEDRVRFYLGSIATPPPEVRERVYDHVVSNPPYHDAEDSRPASEASRALARHGCDLPLDGWIDCCLRRVTSGGRLTLIHRADRLDEVLAALGGGAGDVCVCPLWPRRGQPAKRLITEAVKGSRARLTLAAGLCLHRADGRYTEAAEAILRDCAALELRGGRP